MEDTIDVHKVFAEYFEGCETLAYALSSKLSEGNICIDLKEYREQLPQLLEEQIAKETFNPENAKFWVNPVAFDRQCAEGFFVSHSSDEVKPFIIQGNKAYLQRYFRYETLIIENIKRLGDNFHIITGGPGTGKTYGISTRLVELFGQNMNLKVALAAPTGKAAARMKESIKSYADNPKNEIASEVKHKLSGLDARTIHRLLGYKPDSVFFKHDEKNRLPFEVVIIDECSMVDGAMMGKLLNAIDDNTELYLLGDKDQLAAVEAGSVFGDICRCAESNLLTGKIEVKTESWRFDKNKGIGKFSQQVISGTLNDLAFFDEDQEIEIDTAYSQSLFEQYAIKYKSYIEEPDITKALGLINQVRFLCLTRESVSEVNKKIQYHLFKNVEGFKPKPEGFYDNQPVIITKNDYNLGVFNGDVGIIRKEEKGGNIIYYAWFDGTEGKTLKIPAGYLNNYETVFAMTIHKSQGSEFDYVVVILPEKKGEKLLTRELLYTAVTRAKTKALIQTSEDILMRCVEKSVSRASGLEERLKSENL